MGLEIRMTLKNETKHPTNYNMKQTLTYFTPGSQTANFYLTE